MRTILTIILTVMTFVTANAYKYSYSFNNTPISEAIVRICKDHPDVNISFIYKELDNYMTSARIHTDDAYYALRQTVGLNPISIIRKNKSYYIEALQHGKFRYTGRAIGSDNEPVVAATILLLAPKDSAVITYGITDESGQFSIPCDRQGVIGKLSCLGYKMTTKRFDTFSVGTISMETQAVSLGTVTVEGDNARLYSDKSVYIPTAKQKNASQNAQDLIMRMAIPQLMTGSEIKTATGQTVDIFIDFIPASSGEMAGMRMEDVKRIEYYDYPSDSRFQGKPHVINFIMQQYEYGGYVKGIYYDNFITSRQLNSYAKLQYKKMTFDLAGGSFFMNNKRDYVNSHETFRLLQENGSIREVARSSVVDKTKRKREEYWTSVKALYRDEKYSVSNMVSADFDHTPKHITEGHVTYTPAVIKSESYTSDNSNRINSLVYTGYWHFSLQHGNSISFNPYYAYTHTGQHSSYEETGIEAIINGATDNSHQASGDISFAHSFGKAGTLKALCQGRFLQNKTKYSGTSSTSDMARTFRIGPGVNYSYSSEKFHGNIGAGLHWDKSVYGTIKDISTAPWVNLSLQYAFNTRNSLSVNFSYEKSIPSSSYRSAAVVRSYPLMSYTGNPSLVPYNSVYIDGNYILIPDNRFSISAFGSAWIVGNRYVLDYETGPSEILRTVRQPMGKYSQWQYGLQGSARLSDNRLQLGVDCYMELINNGAPYEWIKSKLITSVSAYYYLDNVYFGATYETPGGYAEGCMTGTWMTSRDSYTFQVGWTNRNWNLRFFTRNFARHNTYQTKGEIKCRYYDSVSYIYGSSDAEFFQISATYTFGYGKKVSADNEAYQVSGASSGILK